MVPATAHHTPPVAQCVPQCDASQDRFNHRVCRLDLATNSVTTLAGSSTAGFLNGVGTNARFDYPSGVAIDPSGTFALVTVRACPLAPPRRAIPHTHTLGTTPLPSEMMPATAHHTTIGSSLSVFLNDASQDSHNFCIRHVDLATKNVTTFAGSGTAGFLNGDGTSAQFGKYAHSVAIDPNGTFALVSVRACPPRRAIPRTDTRTRAIGCTASF